MVGAEDKRAARRAAKDNPPEMGVYRIVAAGVSHVGAALDVRARLNRHRFQLRLGSHPNAALAGAWREAGEDGLRFEVLDVLERDEDGAAPADAAGELALLAALWRDRLAREGETVREI